MKWTVENQNLNLNESIMRVMKIFMIMKNLSIFNKNDLRQVKQYNQNYSRKNKLIKIASILFLLNDHLKDIYK